MGNRNSLEKHSGKWEQNCAPLPLTPPQVDVGSDRAEECGGHRKAEEYLLGGLSREGQPGRDIRDLFHWSCGGEGVP